MKQKGAVCGGVGQIWSLQNMKITVCSTGTPNEKVKNTKKPWGRGGAQKKKKWLRRMFKMIAENLSVKVWDAFRFARHKCSLAVVLFPLHVPRVTNTRGLVKNVNSIRASDVTRSRKLGYCLVIGWTFISSIMGQRTPAKCQPARQWHSGFVCTRLLCLPLGDALSSFALI